MKHSSLPDGVKWWRSPEVINLGWVCPLFLLCRMHPRTCPDEHHYLSVATVYSERLLVSTCLLIIKLQVGAPAVPRGLVAFLKAGPCPETFPETFHRLRPVERIEMGVDDRE